jgi:hypothetical protein
MEMTMTGIATPEPGADPTVRANPQESAEAVLALQETASEEEDVQAHLAGPAISTPSVASPCSDAS